MNLRKYLIDKLPAIAITFFSCGIIMAFIKAFGIRTDIGAAFVIIMLISGLCRLMWDFFRKKRFFDAVENAEMELDKKYLMAEIIGKPDFYEGELMYEGIFAANKSMCENVSEYRRSTEDFREYIEMWVHEVKLPVASLILMSHNDGEDGEKYGEQLRRIDDYIESVLYYARSGNAEKDYIIKEVPLKRCFGAIAVKNRQDLLGKNVTVSTEGLDVSVMTDSKWMEYILGQLLGNSMKYFSDEREPEIRVFAVDKSDRTELHFRDNGIGIPASDLPYIFGKSFTGENGRIRTRSTGMGLYIVKSLCDRLGHDISADSVQGEYTDIVISFGKNAFITNCR